MKYAYIFIFAQENRGGVSPKMKLGASNHHMGMNIPPGSHTVQAIPLTHDVFS
jgi:hypothetical protein